VNAFRVRNLLIPLFLLSVLFNPGFGADYQLAVDAARIVGPLKKFWQEGVGSCHIYMTLNSAQGINFKDHYAMAARELGMKRIRAHGILNDDVGIYKEINGDPVYNWKNLDSIYDYLVSVKMEPLVELSFMPSALASGSKTFGWYNNSPGNITPPKDYDKWMELNYQIAKHVAERYGMATVEKWYWEVWNEPDLAVFWGGTKEDYFKLYDYAVEGITRAIPNAKVGGPSIAISEGTWMDEFIEHCMNANFANPAKKSVKVDFVSWHTYPGQSGQASIVGAHTRTAQRIAAKKAKYPALNVKNFLTEWNTSYKGGDTYNSEIGASFVAKVAHSMFPDQNGGVPAPDVAAFWVISDIWEEWDNTKALAFGPMGMILRQRNARKPSYLAFQMMNMLSDTLVELKGGVKTEPGLNGFATYDKARRRMQILVYDHNRGDGIDIPQAYVDKVRLTVANFPFAAGKLKVQRWGVDRNHNNCFRVWEKSGKPAFPSSGVWDQMEAAGKLSQIEGAHTVTVNGADVELAFDQLQPGVSLFILSDGEIPTGIEDRKGPGEGLFRGGKDWHWDSEGLALGAGFASATRLEVFDSRGAFMGSVPVENGRAAWKAGHRPRGGIFLARAIGKGVPGHLRIIAPQ
jgi:xylan 1,4-beta-xylosidase